MSFMFLQQWQRKWEQDMRPEPTVIKLETLPHLRAWNSMPLPTSDISAYFSDYNENIRRSSNGMCRSNVSKRFTFLLFLKLTAIRKQVLW